MTSPSNSLSNKHPEISKEWHPTKNGKLTSSNVSYGSGKKVWWLCNKGHEWQAFINNRSKGTGCPFCSGRYATSQNNLLATHPSIASQWHTEKNKEQVPENFSAGSHYIAWWICKNSHEWQATIKNRTLGRGCPFCAGKKATPEINLKSLYPEVSDQWHPTKNNDLFPQDFRPQSNTKVWWLCNNGHEWAARIQDRTRGKNSCPYCSKQTSQLEIRLYCELNAVFSEVEWRGKIDGFEIDIFLDKQNIGIEVDSYYWHKNRQEIEQKKQKVVESHGITLVRVREKPLKMVSSFDVLYEQKDSDKKIIKSLLLSLHGLLNKQDKESVISYLRKGVLANKKEFRKILSFIPGPPPDQSLVAKKPKLSAEWNYKKNNPLQPQMFPLQSNKNVWWICEKGHEWKAVIYSRVQGRGCPYCSGRFATSTNNLLKTRPDLALEWHPTKNNELSPENVKSFSSKKVWWKCLKDHEWQSTVANRSKAIGCPYCLGRRVSKENNLAVVNPQLAAEWNYGKNNRLKPNEVTPGSGKKVWWVCPKGHEWRAAIYSRSRRAAIYSRSKGNGCPFCAGKRK